LPEANSAAPTAIKIPPEIQKTARPLVVAASSNPSPTTIRGKPIETGTLTPVRGPKLGARRFGVARFDG
jgi:hypothetical protein